MQKTEHLHSLQLSSRIVTPIEALILIRFNIKMEEQKEMQRKNILQRKKVVDI